MRCLVWMLGCLTFTAGLPSAARAYEDRATLGAAVGYAGLVDADDLPSNAAHFALSAGGGVGDAWSIHGLLSHSIFFDDRRLQLSMAGLETVYALDIVRFVPLLGAGMDGILSVRSREPRGGFALHALLGFDFLVNRRWTVGADARGFWVATHRNSRLGPFMGTVALRASVRFDLR